MSNRWNDYPSSPLSKLFSQLYKLLDILPFSSYEDYLQHKPLIEKLQTRYEGVTYSLNHPEKLVPLTVPDAFDFYSPLSVKTPIGEIERYGLPEFDSGFLNIIVLYQVT